MRFQLVLFLFFFIGSILNGYTSMASDTLNTPQKPIFDSIQYDTLKVGKIVFQNRDSDIFEVIHDSRLKDLLEKDIRINIDKENKMPGFRVQIFASSSRKESETEKARFLALYPSIKAHMIWEQPNFKVRIGDYATRLDAQRAMALISTDFPSYIVRDEIMVKKSSSSDK